VSEQDIENDTKKISNDNITVLITKKPHCQVKFDITVPPHATEAAYQKAIKKVSKDISIPGFRKGKAPTPMILDKYGSFVKEEFVELVLQTAFNEALHLSKEHPMKEGHINRPVVKSCSREQGANFTIEFESRVTFPDIQLDKLQVKKIAVPQITDKESNEAMQQLVTRLADFKPAEDKPVEENDFINLEVIIFGEFPKIIENNRVQVNKEHLPEWILHKVIGLKAGESIEGLTENSDNEFISEEIFHSIPFKATVSAIWEVQLPDLDDELAKKVGLQSLEELKNKMQERLEQTAVEDAFEKQFELIEDALISNFSIDVPKSYLNEEKKGRLQEYLKPLIEKKLSGHIEQHRKSIEAKIEQISLSRLQIYFLMHALAAQNNIQPTEEEISQELVRQTSLMSIGRSRISLADREQLRNQLYNLALEHKIKQFLINHVTLLDE
jgi:trigger factor